MPTTAATGDTGAQTVDEQFLDLICSDADLLAAAFDAIVAAEWREPPTDRSGRDTGGRAGRARARRTADLVRGPALRPRHPGIGGWARQRSPPFETHDSQEGR
jgi:hypothetical protein